jgi:heptosyltransferase-2
MVGGLAETERLQRLAAALPPQRMRLALNVPLAELAALLQSCSCFVGHDSGISHLAAALGLPGLLLWGPTEEKIWRPPSDKMNVLRAAGGLKTLSVEEVIGAFGEIKKE